MNILYVFCMIWEYIKKVPEWNSKFIRWDNTHFDIKLWDNYITGIFKD